MTHLSEKVSLSIGEMGGGVLGYGKGLGLGTPSKYLADNQLACLVIIKGLGLRLQPAATL